MATVTHEATIDEFHLGSGGPLRRLEVRLRLTRLRWQIAWVVAVTWVPIVVLSGVSDWTEQLMHDPAVHVRLLVASPVLLFLDQLFPRVCRRSLLLLNNEAFVPDAEKPRFLRTVRSATRLADSPVPEALLGLLSIALSMGALLRVVPTSYLAARSDATTAELWYAVIALPLFEFLLFRSLWRWAIWVRVLMGLARIRLDLDPTHPDCRGGLAFLRLPSIGYCATLLFAVASVLCAEWQHLFIFGVTLVSFAPLLVLFATAGTLIAFGPLLLFAPQLIRARYEGLVEVGGLAHRLGRQFRRRWIEGTSIGGEGELSADAQALSAVGSSYRESVDRLHVLLFDRRDMVVLLIATLLPVVPVMLTRVPRGDWMNTARLLSRGVVG